MRIKFTVSVSTKVQGIVDFFILHERLLMPVEEGGKDHIFQKTLDF